MQRDVFVFTSFRKYKKSTENVTNPRKNLLPGSGFDAGSTKEYKMPNALWADKCTAALHHVLQPVIRSADFLHSKWSLSETSKCFKSLPYCWWFRNPANQLRLVVYPIIYKVLAPSQMVIWWISEPSRDPTKKTKVSPPFSDAKKPSLWRNASTTLHSTSTAASWNESKPKSKHIGHGVIQLAQKGKKKKGGTFLLSVSWEKNAKKNPSPPLQKRKKIGIQPQN